jgi:transcription termination/antitermination protein NusG
LTLSFIVQLSICFKVMYIENNNQSENRAISMKRWYVVQVYAGHEEIVKNDILKRIKEGCLEDLFGEVLIPSARVKNMLDVAVGKNEHQLFPGYLLVEMEMAHEARRLVETSLRVVKFLGGKDPVPLAQKEVDRIISQIKGDVVVASKKSEFVVGSEVEISDGPFTGFVGVIDAIDEEAERLAVMVSIFGRMTPIELSFNQVKH